MKSWDSQVNSSYGELLRSSTSPGNSDVFICELGGVRCLLKTFARHCWLARVLFGWQAIRNESAMLRALEAANCAYAPKLYETPDRYTLVMELITPATDLLSRRHYTPVTLPTREFFRELMAIVNDFHAKGFAHGDLRRANILIDAAGHPHLIDWATGTQHPQTTRWHWFQHWLHHHLVESDNYSLAKMVRHYYPDALPPELASALQPGRLLRFASWLRRNLYRRGIKRWFRGKK